jgi:hypothetical protein
MFRGCGCCNWLQNQLHSVSNIEFDLLNATWTDMLFPSAMTYKDFRVNDTLCQVYVEDMADLGEKIIHKQEAPGTISTDMGL